jgi:GntR family transcriptional regulator/MocR family aminotransferase
VRRWDLTVALDPDKQLRLYLQLANAIADDIRRGRLKPGEALPGSRALAESLGVNRNTVVAGYDELAAEGLVCTRMGGGTSVAEPPPVPEAAAPHPEQTPTYALPTPLHRQPPISPPAPGMLVISRALPDVRLLPARSRARAFGRAVGRQSRALLTYPDPRGHARLRSELATMLSRPRALPATPETVLVARSVEHALDLVARMLLSPGDAVAMEEFSYPPARRMLRMAGARLLPVRVDDDGLDVGALEKLLSKEPLRAVFVMPHHQFPTATVMSQARRALLAELALRHRFAIIEDDYDHELHYEGKPVLPIAAGTGAANVIYVGSLSNLLSTGLSTAFVVAPPPVYERLVSIRAASDAQCAPAVDCAIAELFEEGEILRHVRRMRRVYASRRDTLAAAPVRHLGSAVRFRVPEGGMGLWVHAADDIDVRAWALAGEREGVTFCDARDYDFHHREHLPFLRLGFTFLDEAKLEEAVRRMARARKCERRGRCTSRSPPARSAS